MNTDKRSTLSPPPPDTCQEMHHAHNRQTAIGDETERKKNEEKNRQINLTLKAAQEMAGLAYWGYDLRADRVEWSEQMYRLLHRAPDRGPLLKDEFKQMIHTDDWDICVSAIRKAIHAGEYGQAIMRMTTPDCVLRWFSMQCHPHRDETGRTVRLNGIIQDITELKEAESARKNLEAQLRQSQKLEAIGTMTAGIAHDFNNILGIIVGNAELASDGIHQHSEEKQNLDEILQAALRGKEIIKQLLSFNKKSDTRKRPLDLTRLVKESLHFIRVAVPSNIRISHTPLTTPHTIYADAGQIHQVLMNLCTNAAHAMEPAGGVLDIRIQAVTTDQITIAPSDQIAPGDYVCLSVADTGCGIEPACVGRVFDPYFTTKEVGKGSGLGLAVVHGILRKHDAHIRVESTLNQGSRFSILFPTYRAPLMAGEPPVEQGPLARGSESILLVDDEKALVAATAAILSRLGYKTTLTTDSREALRLFHTAPHKFDLVISDMVMPDMNGDLLSRKIKEIRPDVPILICTGYSDTIDQSAAKELGVQVVEKPLTKNKLAALMREMLDRP